MKEPRFTQDELRLFRWKIRSFWLTRFFLAEYLVLFTREFVDKITISPTSIEPAILPFNLVKVNVTWSFGTPMARIFENPVLIHCFTGWSFKCHPDRTWDALLKMLISSAREIFLEGIIN